MLVTVRARTGALVPSVECAWCGVRLRDGDNGWCALLPEATGEEAAICCSLACQQEVRALDRSRRWQAVSLDALLFGLASRHATALLECPICRSPSAQAVTNALLMGEPQRSIGARLAWSKGSLAKHSKHVLRERGGKPAKLPAHGPKQTE